MIQARDNGGPNLASGCELGEGKDLRGIWEAESTDFGSEKIRPLKRKKKAVKWDLQVSSMMKEY